MAEFGTVLESWYPLGHGDAHLLNEPVLVELARKYAKTPAQIILRWHIEEKNSVFPKTTNPQHMKENFDIFDFSLSAEDMTKIATLNSGKRYFTDNLEQQQRFTKWKPAD